MAVLREGRMIGHLAVEPEPAKPAIRQVEVHLFAQPPLRADAEAIADNQHANQQLWIDRRPADLTVEGHQRSRDTLSRNEDSRFLPGRYAKCDDPPASSPAGEIRWVHPNARSGACRWAAERFVETGA